MCLYFINGKWTKVHQRKNYRACTGDTKSFNFFTGDFLFFFFFGLFKYVTDTSVHCSQKLVEILFCSCFVLCFSKKHGLEICSLILHSWNFVNHCFNPEIYLNGMKMIYRAIHSCNFIFFHLWLYLIDLENYITSIKW